MSEQVSLVDAYRAVAEAERLCARVAELEGLVREAVPFVDDAGNDECPEARARAIYLLERMRRVG